MRADQHFYALEIIGLEINIERDLSEIGRDRATGKRGSHTARIETADDHICKLVAGALVADLQARHDSGNFLEPHESLIGQRPAGDGGDVDGHVLCRILPPLRRYDDLLDRVLGKDAGAVTASQRCRHGRCERMDGEAGWHRSVLLFHYWTHPALAASTV